MPDFFIPYMDDATKAEETWEAIQSFMEDTHGWHGITAARIFRLDYMHDGKHMEAEVGVPHPYGYETSWDLPDQPEEKEWVVAILETESGPFLVCTHSRGVVRGEPILVGRGEPYQVTYFDDYWPD